MILDTMTTEEVLREIKSDSREVKARWRKFSTKFRKLILKRQSFPWLWETTIKQRNITNGTYHFMPNQKRGWYNKCNIQYDIQV